MDFHTLEQWTFDIIHCYFRLPDRIAKVNVLGIAGWEKIKIASTLHNIAQRHVPFVPNTNFKVY